MDALKQLHAGKPIDTDGPAGGVAPELNELLYGENAGEILDAAAVFGMSAFELLVSLWISREPADVGHADDIAVQIGLQNAGAAIRTAPIPAILWRHRIIWR